LGWILTLGRIRFIYIILILFSLPAGLVVLILHYTVELGPGRKMIVYNTKQLAALIDFHSRHKERGGKLSMDTVRYSVPSPNISAL
jgi:hypothetical protein